MPNGTSTHFGTHSVFTARRLRLSSLPGVDDERHKRVGLRRSGDRKREDPFSGRRFGGAGRRSQVEREQGVKLTVNLHVVPFGPLFCRTGEATTQFAVVDPVAVWRRKALGIHRKHYGQQSNLHAGEACGHVILNAFGNARLHMCNAEDSPGSARGVPTFKEEVNFRGLYVPGQIQFLECAFHFRGTICAHPDAENLKRHLVGFNERSLEREARHPLPLLVRLAERDELSVDDVLPDVAWIRCRTSSHHPNKCPRHGIRDLRLLRDKGLYRGRGVRHVIIGEAIDLDPCRRDTRLNRPDFDLCHLSPHSPKRNAKANFSCEAPSEPSERTRRRAATFGQLRSLGTSIAQTPDTSRQNPNIDADDFGTSRALSNQGLDLTNPDAAQSVASAPLCLLSGLAAQAHVGRSASRSDRGDLDRGVTAGGVARR